MTMQSLPTKQESEPTTITSSNSSSPGSRNVGSFSSYSGCKEKDREIEKLRSQLALMREGMRLLAAQIRQADRQADRQGTMLPSSSLSPRPPNEMMVMKKSLTGSRDDDDDTLTAVTELCDNSTVVSETQSVLPVVPSTTATTTSTTTTSTMDPCEQRFEEITQQLTQGQTADLMAVHNAVRMVQQHAKLSTQEVTWAVQDSVDAQRLVQTWQEQYHTMEKKVTKVQAKNTALLARNTKLATERRLLIQEVRKLRQQESNSQQFQTNVWEAMQLHQEHLKQKTMQLLTVEGGSNADNVALPSEQSTTSTADLKTEGMAMKSDDISSNSSSSSSERNTTPPSSPVNLYPRSEVDTISPITPAFLTTPTTIGSTMSDKTEHHQKHRRHHHHPTEDLMMPRTIF